MMSTPSIAPKVKHERFSSYSLAILEVELICRFPLLFVLSYRHCKKLHPQVVDPEQMFK